MNQISRLSRDITHCVRCPRLIQHCRRVAEVKKREFRDQNYWGKPVPSFGDSKAWLWIIGLAPAAHGANRTGRMFTGDSSGHWLYRALHHVGIANQPLSKDRNDGLKLKGAYISAAAHCAPPDNKPSKDELNECFPYLEREYELLKNVTTILALGKIAFDTTVKLLIKKGVAMESRPKFAHGTSYNLRPRLLSSYHPSRQNTQTGRLTEKMWLSVFESLEDHPTGKHNLVRSLKANRLQVPLAP